MKSRQTAALLVFIVFQATYLALCIVEHRSSLFILASVGLILGIVLLEYVAHYQNHSPGDANDFDLITIASCTIAAAATFFLNNTAGLGPAAGAGIVGSVAGLLAARGKATAKAIEVPAYCGAFVGMSSTAVLPGIAPVLCAGVACGFLYNMTHGTFHGYGGRLGTVAFASVSLCALAIKMLSS